MLLNDFSGGLNTRIAPSLLPKNQSQVYSNIDNTSATIKPILGPLDVSTAIEKFFVWYRDQSEYVAFPTETTYSEYQQLLYYTKLNSHPLRYDGTNEYRLGIVAPTNKPVVGLDVAGNLTGTYTYGYTFYDSITGNESAPSLISGSVVATADSILVDNILVSADPQVDKVRLYRIGGSIADYTLVVELPNGTLTYVDDNTDLSIAGSHLLDSWTHTEAPDNLKYITENYAILFGAIGNNLVYSEIGKPGAWPATNFIDFEDTITGIATMQGGLLVYTIDRTYFISGTSHETFSKTLFDGEQGCISHHTIQYIDNNLVWMSRDGLCATSGGLTEVISLTPLGILNLEGLNNAEVYNRVYYVSYAGGLLAFDFRYNTMVRHITTVCEWLHKHDDELYSNIGGQLFKMFSGEPMEYIYKSPILTEGNFSQRKDYKDFYLKYNGDIHLTLSIDGKVVNEKDLTGDSAYNLKALSSASGYGLVIDITGTGEVQEIEYKAGGRQNGR